MPLENAVNLSFARICRWSKLFQLKLAPAATALKPISSPTEFSLVTATIEPTRAPPAARVWALKTNRIALKEWDFPKLRIFFEMHPHSILFYQSDKQKGEPLLPQIQHFHRFPLDLSNDRKDTKQENDHKSQQSKHLGVFLKNLRNCWWFYR